MAAVPLFGAEPSVPSVGGVGLADRALRAGWRPTQARRGREKQGLRERISPPSKPCLEGVLGPPGPVVVAELPSGGRYVPRPGAREIDLLGPDRPRWRRYRPGRDAPPGAEVRIVRADSLAAAAVEGLGHIPADPLPDSPGGSADPWDRSVD